MCNVWSFPHLLLIAPVLWHVLMMVVWRLLLLLLENRALNCTNVLLSELDKGDPANFEKWLPFFGEF